MEKNFYRTSYKTNDNFLTYINASRGFRNGGQNVYTFLYPDVTESPYKSELLWNYELGLKSVFFDGKLTTNLAFYYNKWNDMQVITRNISEMSLTENVASVHSTGVDAEINLNPLKGLLCNFCRQLY